ncbi:probable methyltransferase (homolog to DNA-cytosine methyltransferase) [Halomonas elongata DSM 2581]|uniref:DNA (cytosine-5-)-methyltransferase n=2 Tax=Halomonas elongata (strain ATCC 33173 / DSM 2581 / NBRC 15536 / NCIMB 2198 / 1H9) TaxID=768066 RepID=E1VAZ1_HALED|nr:probable methyltransferase (homolog to DNA-cytosine methyltransferase) [Halomonas elongata DSM 2581]
MRILPWPWPAPVPHTGQLVHHQGDPPQSGRDRGGLPMTTNPPSDLAWRTQFALEFEGEINVDLFAGGGGASTGLEMGLNRPVHVAINHDADAISMHQANHPGADHYLSDVYEVDPLAACQGRPVGHFHASPDCTHFTQASGGQPRKQAIRSLSWVVHKWAGKIRPRVITLENVEQILQWSPLVAKRCKQTGRVVKIDRTVAAPGERVPLEEQFLVPDRRRRGHNWQHFVAGLRRLGYAVQWRTLRACDYGAPTTRERLFLIARCDGRPIVWPEPTHHKHPKRGQKRWRAAAECIDWSIPTRSIFDRPRPLADNTLRRIAKGIQKFVIDSGDPLIVPIANYGGTADAVHPIDEPLRTVTASPKGGAFALASATLVQTGYGERPGQSPRALDIRQPLGTVVAGGGKHALVTAFMAQMNGGFYDGAGRDLRDPLSTITGRGTQQQLVTAHLATLRRNSHGADIRGPLTTIAAQGGHHALVECRLSPDDEAGALRVAAFLINYYGKGQPRDLREPLDTITTRDRLALVTVTIQGTPYVIVDIALRMLKPRELYRAQGFPDSYIIDRGHDGRRFTLTAQTRMCGNSVSPLPMAAIARANRVDHPAVSRRAANDETREAS